MDIPIAYPLSAKGDVADQLPPSRDETEGSEKRYEIPPKHDIIHLISAS